MNEQLLNTACTIRWSTRRMTPTDCSSRTRSMSDNHGYCLPPWQASTTDGTAIAVILPITWRKSSFSETPQGACVEVALAVTGAAVRDSKNTVGPTLRFGASQWRTFSRACAKW
jgi:hypothetical protein